MKNIKVSIIIVHYKAKKELFSCIESIYNSKAKVNFEVIVVDNDDVKTIEKDLRSKFNSIRYIKSKNNLGYGYGNNLGAKFASGEYLFFLNPDTLFLGNVIDTLINFFDVYKKVGIVAPLLIDKNNVPYKLQGHQELTPFKGIIVLSFLNKLLPNIYDNFWNINNKKIVNENYSIPGTAFMIKKAYFNSVGKFDERFFLYFEENDICKRVNLSGYKVFIEPKAKVFHEWGISTKNLQSTKKIFADSRYLYFKKHYGIYKALLVELFLKINKFSILFLALVLLAFFLRLNNLSTGMSFIGDQGWFYLSAKDLLIDGNIPLVGITSSHTWLHQGPLWTYMLSIVLLIFKFNPLAGGYLTVLFGTLTTLLMFKLGSTIFSARVGIIAAFLYAASPLVVFFDRMPFDPSPIPFFTVLYLYSLYKWVKGNINFFPLIILLIALLYNLELATFTLFFPFVIIFIYGFIKNKQWVRKVFNKKTLIYSFMSLFIPMLPIIVYDLSNGFKQTIVFIGWIFYKPFSFLIKHQSDNLFSNFKIVLDFLGSSIQKLVFQQNQIIALLIFILSIFFLIYLVFKKNKNKLEDSKFILLFLLVISFMGIFANQTPSDAYLPIIFPLVFFAIGLLFSYLSNFKLLKYPVIFLVIVMVLVNACSSLKNNLSQDYKLRLDATSKIINLVNDEKYNLVGKGPGSQFSSFTMNYEYLLWWKGHPPSKSNEVLKIIVSETPKGIIISKKHD